MASESRDERTMSVNLPADLSEWLDEHAATLEVERETLLVQLVSAYRITADGEDGEEPFVDPTDLDDRIAAQLDSQLEERLDDTLDDILEGRIDDRIAEATEAVQRQLTNSIDTLEEDYRENLEDVRQRTIQVKREADGKAPADHDHEHLAEIPALSAELDGLADDLGDLRATYEETVPAQEREIESLSDRLDTLEERLQTVAWVVSDLREAQEADGGLAAVERIKRAAAKADVERANCERCGESVAIGLLTDPECPHCSATVSNVEPAGRWFGKPKLLAASQLESGDAQ